MSNPTHEPFEIDFWSQCLAAAPVEGRDGIAIKWLDSWLLDLSRQYEHPGFITNEYFVPNMQAIRNLVWALPDNYRPPVIRDAKSEVIWLAEYLTGAATREKAASEKASDVASGKTLVRDLWLAPTLNGRTEALYSFASNIEILRNSISFRSVLLRNAAWAVAIESGMSNAAVMAATKITCNTIQDVYNYNYITDQKVLHAMAVVLKSREFPWPNKQDDLLVADAVNILREYPSACTQMLLFWDDNAESVAKRRPAALPESPAIRAERFDSLIAWLPAYADVIRLAQSFDLSYRGTLEHLGTGFLAETPALPVDIAAGIPL